MQNVVFENQKLGKWCSEQRKKYKDKKLSKDKVNLLENIANWSWKINNTWHESYELLKEYIKINNNKLIFKKNIYKKMNIDAWCYNQRTNYKKGQLSESKIKKLENLNNWNWIINNDWDESYELLKEYINENNKIPLSNTKFKDKNLGMWCFNQCTNYKKGLLSEIKIQKLQNINRWSWILNNIWLQNYNLLKDYISEFGKLPTTNTQYKDINIGKWCGTQRSNYKRHKLTQNKINKLENIREWYWLLYNKWNDSYQLLKKYVQENNKLPLQKIKYKEINIGVWCNNQRKNYKKGQLPQIKIDKLNKINGWYWELYHAWDKGYNLLKEYIQIYNNLPIYSTKYKKKNIGSWCNKQRYEKKLS